MRSVSRRNLRKSSRYWFFVFSFILRFGDDLSTWKVSTYSVQGRWLKKDQDPTTVEHETFLRRKYFVFFELSSLWLSLSFVKETSSSIPRRVSDRRHEGFPITRLSSRKPGTWPLLTTRPFSSYFGHFPYLFSTTSRRPIPSNRPDVSPRGLSSLRRQGTRSVRPDVRLDLWCSGPGPLGKETTPVSTSGSRKSASEVLTLPHSSALLVESSR